MEEQQSEAANRTRSVKHLTAEQIQDEQTRQGLELSRQRVMQQLQSACNPNHRSMLERALVDLDERLANLKPGT